MDLVPWIFIFYSFFMEISQKIIDYAIWYYLKYYPSPKKLRFKLKEKFGPDSEKGKKYWGIFEEDIEFIISEKLRNIIEEEEVIESKIRRYKDLGKSKMYIKNKMFLRMEDKNLVEEKLEIYFENWEIENIKKELKKLWFSKELEYNEKNKIIKKLLTRGFRYDEIKSLI